LIKQHGALLAKGRLLGVQFDTLFTDGLYETIGVPAIRAAEAVRNTLRLLGYPLYIDSPTNQIFPVIADDKLVRLRKKAEVSFWEKYDEDRTVIRIATDWGTTKEETEALLAIFKEL
ncbi:MAG: low specificity L-threonine aldolase, partial [Lachnospiraceae bacterium]|nr:low specificity L-threonine aldolase [Lachnospiraceae bacterium]